MSRPSGSLSTANLLNQLSTPSFVPSARELSNFGPLSSSFNSFQSVASRPLQTRGLSSTTVPTTSAPSFLDRVGSAINTATTFAQEFGRTYVDYVGTGLSTAGTTFNNNVRNIGTTVGDIASGLYYDPAGKSREIRTSLYDAGVGLKNAAVYAYNNPDATVSGLASSAGNYLDRLTSDPRVSGELLGNYGTTVVSGGVTAAGKQVVGRGLSALNSLFGPKLRAPIQVELELATEFEKRAAQYAANELGETVIQSQIRQGAVNKGFDFISFTGTGKNSRLFINEVKNVTGKVASSSFSVFGLGKSQLKSFDNALSLARTAIYDAGLDKRTRDALIDQLLPGGGAAIRLIGSQSKGTVFNPYVNDLIGKTTGFITGEGFHLK